MTSGVESSVSHNNENDKDSLLEVSDNESITGSGIMDMLSGNEEANIPSLVAPQGTTYTTDGLNNHNQDTSRINSKERLSPVISSNTDLHVRLSKSRNGNIETEIKVEEEERKVKGEEGNQKRDNESLNNFDDEKDNDGYLDQIVADSVSNIRAKLEPAKSSNNIASNSKKLSSPIIKSPSTAIMNTKRKYTKRQSHPFASSLLSPSSKAKNNSDQSISSTKHTNQLQFHNSNDKNKAPTHNLASLPSWMVHILSQNSKYLCAKWDQLNLGTDVGSVALNEYLNSIQGLNDDDDYNDDCNENERINPMRKNTNDRKYKLTANDVLNIIDTLRPKTCDPPENSILRSLNNKNVDNNNNNNNNMGHKSKVVCEYPDDDDNDDDDNHDDVFISDNGQDKNEEDEETRPSTTHLDRVKNNNSQSQNQIQIPSQNNSHQRKQGEKHPRVPWQSLIHTYALMNNQDSLQYCTTPLKRRKIHYMEYTQVIEKLKTFENEACELNMREESMKRKQKHFESILSKKKKVV